MVCQPCWSATRPNILLICFKIKTCDFHKWQVAANYNLKATNYEAFLVLFVVLFKTPKKESLLKNGKRLSQVACTQHYQSNPKITYMKTK